MLEFGDWTGPLTGVTPYLTVRSGAAWPFRNAPERGFNILLSWRAELPPALALPDVSDRGDCRRRRKRAISIGGGDQL
jgi:hypothetical protein